MMAVLWNDVLDDVKSAKRHLTQAVAIFDEAFQTPVPSYMAVMAFQHAMQSAYTSFEAGLKRLFVMLDEPVPVGPGAHRALLRRVAQDNPGARPAILTAAMLHHLDELRRFRHVAMHSYDDFQPQRAEPPAAAARYVLAHVDAELARFRAAIDPPA